MLLYHLCMHTNIIPLSGLVWWNNLRKKNINLTRLLPPSPSAPPDSWALHVEQRWWPRAPSEDLGSLWWPWQCPEERHRKVSNVGHRPWTCVVCPPVALGPRHRKSAVLATVGSWDCVLFKLKFDSLQRRHWRQIKLQKLTLSKM